MPESFAGHAFTYITEEGPDFVYKKLEFFGLSYDGGCQRPDAVPLKVCQIIIEIPAVRPAPGFLYPGTGLAREQDSCLGIL